MSKNRRQFAGRVAFVKSATLPRGMQDPQAFRRMGIKVGPIVGYDARLVKCILPRGWKKQATDGRSFFDLIDQQGRIRASIMYDEARTHAPAFMYPVPRFCVKVFKSGGGFIAEVRDGLAVVFEVKDAEESPAFKGAIEWLDREFPSWREPSAYWNEAVPAIRQL
jgi:hypothetical protein